jgi:hypothetical protein
MALPVRLPVRKRKQPERGLHLAVANFLRMALPDDGEVLWWHTPNGGMRHKAEARLLKQMGTLAGIFEFTFVYCGLARGIELKHESYPSQAQRRVYRWAGRAGMQYAICRSVDEVQAALESWSIPLRARTFGFGPVPRKTRKRAA